MHMNVRKVNDNRKEKIRMIEFSSYLYFAIGNDMKQTVRNWFGMNIIMILSIGTLYSANSLLRFGTYIVFHL